MADEFGLKKPGKSRNARREDARGDRPGSNLTCVELGSLSAIASLQHRLNELQTGARIVMG